MRKPVFIFLLLLKCICINAQERINILISNEGNIPLPGVVVNVYNSSNSLITSATSDNAGKVAVDIPAFPVQLVVFGNGYDTVHQEITGIPNEEVHVVLTRKASALNEVVVTGLLTPTRASDASSIYKVISESTIRAQGSSNVGEVLQKELNIQVSNDPVLGTMMQMQGLTGNKMKVLLDGVPIAGREAGNIDLGQISVTNVKKIEIIQGPMSVVYGTDAIGGVINIITKQNAKAWSGEAQIYYESVGQYNAFASASKTFNKHSIALGFGRNFFKGWQYVDTTSPHRELLFKPKEQYLGNISYQYTAKSGFKLKLASDNIHEKLTCKGPAIVSPFQGKGWDQYYRNFRSINRLIVDGKIGKSGSWQMSNGYSLYKRSKQTLIKDLVNLSAEPSAGTEDNDTTTFDEFNFRGGYSNKWKSIDFTVGYDLDIQRGSTRKIPGGERQISEGALYGLFQWQVLPGKLSTEAGIRTTANSTYGNQFIPSLSLRYKPNDQLTFRTSFANGFRSPTLKEFYLDFVDANHDVKGNPDLKPERSNHVQVSGSYQVEKENGNYSQLKLVGYYNDISDEIMLVKIDANNALDRRYVYANNSKNQNFIISSEFEAQKESFYFRLGYSFRHTFGQEGYDGFNVHELTSNARYSWKKSGISISLFNKLVGSQPSSVMNIDGSVSFQGTLPAYDLMDISIQKKLLKGKMEITGGLKNILDVQTVAAQGVTTTPVHASDGSASFLPRRFFAGLRIILD
jgi:outer membrane receptor for ferrienterochelin and colicins